MNAVAAHASANQSARFPWRVLLIGFGAYILFLLATLPAIRITSYLQRQGVMLAGVSGSIWNGSAAAVQVNGMSLGQVSWDVSAWRLLSGALHIKLNCKRDDGYLDAIAQIGLGNRITLREVRGSLPIGALTSLGLPGGSGWSGTLQLQMDELALANRWPTQVLGSLAVENLVGPPNQPTALGSFTVTFPAPNAQAAAGELLGSVVSRDDSPLDVVGTLRLQPTRNYEIDATVGARANAQAAIGKALQYLGPPDAQGRRPFSLAGSL